MNDTKHKFCELLISYWYNSKGTSMWRIKAHSAERTARNNAQANSSAYKIEVEKTRRNKHNWKIVS